MAERELLHRIFINAPIQAVWDELTRLNGKQRALMDSVLVSGLNPGDPLYYKSLDGKRVFVVGRVLEVDAPRRLSHTQRLTMRDDPWTIVTWELEESEGGTSVTLRHGGWPADTPKLENVSKTWDMILPALKQVVETGNVGFGLKFRYAMMRTFMWAMPASTKAENVPEPE